MSEQTVDSVSTSPELTKEITTPESSSPVEENKQFVESFQRIAKQEKHLAEERQRLKEASKSLEQDKLDAEAYRQSKKLKDEDPFALLSHFGLTFDELQMKALEKAKPVDPAAKKALEAVARLEGELRSKEEQMLKEKHVKAEMTLITNIDKTIKEGEYDIIEKLNAQQTVREYMEEIYEATGEIDYKAACDAVTNHIVNLYQKISDSKWVKPKETTAEKSTESKQEIPSISNKMTQSTVSQDKPMTEAERIKAAIRVMETFKPK